MNNDEPIAYFITWTVYGTFLQGDIRGWRKRRKGEQAPQPLLADWRRERLKHRIELLAEKQRDWVNREIERLCGFRHWHLWAHDARTNHVHVVVTANGFAGTKVRDQLKANCTRILREGCSKFIDRPIWTVGGDVQCINTEEELESVILYVRDAQDNKQCEYHQPHDDQPLGVSPRLPPTRLRDEETGR